nr:nucleotide exchange factor GrpE [Aestuariimicrobium ganziense]
MVADPTTVGPEAGATTEPELSGEAEQAEGDPQAARIAELEALVAERTADLQRLGAEYANYKRRVDRDRELAKQSGVEKVVLDLLPVLDSIDAARAHDEVKEGFAMVAGELEKLAGKYGLVGYGAKGDEFDPQFHEALMHMPLPEPVSVTTCSEVMQRGYTLHGKVLRPARVAVADPQ